MNKPRITYDKQQIPGIEADNAESAFYGIGQIHAKHRAESASLMWTVALGQLKNKQAEKLQKTLEDLDVFNKAKQQVEQLSDNHRQLLSAYIKGFNDEFYTLRSRPLLSFLMPLSKPTLQNILASIALFSFVGHVEVQKNLKQMLWDILQDDSVDLQLLKKIFSPHFDDLDATWLQLLRQIDCQSALSDANSSSSSMAHSMSRGGSNAWAVGAQYSRSGAPLLGADPHLEISKLPGDFLPIRLRILDQYVLGVSIAGLPFVAIGRNKHLAWGVTYACGDVIDAELVPLVKASSTASYGLRWHWPSVDYLERVASLKFLIKVA